MPHDHDRMLVKCVDCRELYVPRAGAAAGCPHCGCPTWVSAWIGEEVPRRSPAHAA